MSASCNLHGCTGVVIGRDTKWSVRRYVGFHILLGKIPEKSWERFSVATCVLLGWESSLCLHGSSRGACPRASGLCRVPAVTGLAESSPSNLEFEDGSAIAALTVGDDGLDDELLFVVLGHTDEILDHIDWVSLLHYLIETTVAGE